MKVFVAGATGAIGRPLVPQLVEAGHTVTAMSRSARKADAVKAAGAELVTADGLDREAVVSAVEKAQPDVVIHQLTAIPANTNLRRIDRDFELTDRLRTEGTDNLLAGARAAGARRFLIQSFGGGWTWARQGGPVKTESDPLDDDTPPRTRRMLDAIRYLEDTVTGAEDIEGLALRYGFLYGPGTALAKDGLYAEILRKRRFPIVGSGAGIWSFIHVDDAASATVAAVERGEPGIYNVVDDDPAPVSEWLPELARAVGAKPPRRVPGFVGRLALGRHGLIFMNEMRGSSNAKAKQELRWHPQYASWRTGFRAGL